MASTSTQTKSGSFLAALAVVAVLATAAIFGVGLRVGLHGARSLLDLPIVIVAGVALAVAAATAVVRYRSRARRRAAK